MLLNRRVAHFLSKQVRFAETAPSHVSEMQTMRILLCWKSWLLGTLCLLVLGSGLDLAGPSAKGAEDDDSSVARSLAAMLRAGRAVISRHQEQINNPDIGDKGLGGKNVLMEALEIYKETTGEDPESIDPKSRRGRLVHAQMDAIVEVIDANQQTLNQRGVGFKGLIPATFGRLVNEAFAKRAAAEAEIKVTAPPELVRNRKARPDKWEAEVIRDKLLGASWPKGQIYAALAESSGRPAFRVTVPEYYAASCLSCHGSPKGEIDVTGYPKEGGKEGDLGGVISITLYH